MQRETNCNQMGENMPTRMNCIWRKIELNFQKERRDFYNRNSFQFLVSYCPLLDIWSHFQWDWKTKKTLHLLSFFPPLALVCVRIEFHIRFNRTHYLSLLAYVEQSRCRRQLCVWKSLFITREIAKGVLLAVDRQELQSTMLLLYSIDPSVYIIESGK